MSQISRIKSAIELGGEQTMQDSTRAASEGQSSALVWIRPERTRGQFELRSRETVLATLTWSRGSSALAQWGAGQYHFNRQGWLRPRVLVRDASAGDTSDPLATFTQRGGALTFHDGRVFLWKKPKWLTNERIWAEAAGTELVRFRAGRHSTVSVTTSPEAAQQTELPVLILLGQYLLVLAAQDEAAVAATTAAVIAST
jgi:hypothetical protein